jgi:uncharacterized protein YidB (DUF937 family)
MGVLDSIFGSDGDAAASTGGLDALGGGAAKPLMLAVLGMFASRALSGGNGNDAGGSQRRDQDSDLGAGGVLGGLGGLLESFQQNGQADTVNSWVNSGPNRSVSPDQLRNALGSDRLDQLARRTGMSQQDLLAQLSQILPGAVDRLTPEGRLPTKEELKRQAKARAKAQLNL